MRPSVPTSAPAAASTPPHARSAAAFTLVELLAVVAIIAAMLALLLPAMNKARDAARSVKCLHNQSQVGVALQVFATDHLGVIPQNTSIQTPSDGHSYGLWWYNYLTTTSGRTPPSLQGNYIKKNSVLYCPEMERNDPVDGPGTYGMFGHNKRNPIQFSQPFPQPDRGNFVGLQINRIPKAADYAALFDTTSNDVINRLGHGIEGWGPSASPSGGYPQHSGGIWLAHTTAANAWFYDGHAEAVHESRFKDLANSAAEYGDITLTGVESWFSKDGQFIQPLPE